MKNEPSDLTSLRSTFDKFSHQTDSLSVEDIADLLVHLGHDGGREELVNKAIEYDVDRSGRLSFNEFVFMAQV